jgi:5'-deoxynucleotidase YfbR-like HD superfamily hydrolase
MTERTYRPGDHEIELASGRYLDLVNPDPAAITLDDIAHGLAHTCRYAGHTRRFYSVAEHAVLVAAKLRAEGQPLAVQMSGLHHDDAEAFIADIARPLKTLLQPAYDAISGRLDGAIGLALHVALPALFLGDEAATAVKDADNWALAAEAYHLLPSKGVGWWSHGLYDPADESVIWVDSLGQRPDFARQQFIQAHQLLARKIAEEAA